MDKSAALRAKISELAEDIMSYVDDGECFYEEDMLHSFILRLDELKESSKKYFEMNQEEEE